MAHIGIICPAASGHLNPMTSLGYELQKRRHRVTLLGIADAYASTVAAGLNFQVIGESEFPLGATAQWFADLGEQSGLTALQYTIKHYLTEAEMLFRDVPVALSQVGVEALLVDQAISEGSTIAEIEGIPFVTVCNSLIMNTEVGVPPFFTSWIYNSAWWARLRNQAGYSLITRLIKPLRQVVNEHRQKRGLLPYSADPSDFCSQIAILSQQPAEFEFPRRHLPQWFHFTGPYSASVSRELVSFPWEKLTGQPLVYASLGTIQNRLMWIFQTIAEACVGLDAQLVISLGGSANPESLPKLPGEPLVVKYAPQLEILQKATITVTHAGLNTTLESLSNGVPLVAIPIANDQPGVAARIAWTGAGEVVQLSRLSVPKLRTAIQRVLTQDSYKNNASRLQRAIEKSGGVIRAADIVEQAISTGQPVLTHANL